MGEKKVGDFKIRGCSQIKGGNREGGKGTFTDLYHTMGVLPSTQPVATLYHTMPGMVVDAYPAQCDGLSSGLPVS